MKLAIVAATGGVGRHVLDQAIAAGHQVTAIARNPDGLPGRTVRVDLAAPDPVALRSAVAGSDAVISGLGPRGTAEFGIVSAGTRAITEAMRATNVRRLVVVSVAGISTIPTPNRPNPRRRDPGVGFFTRTILSPIARSRLGEHYADVALMEDDLRASGLDWTSVQLPLLTNKPLTERYRIAYEQSVRSGWRISRADVAHFILKILSDPETFNHSIAIAHAG
jgi:putative NADH-flavin reductase